jgi:2-hydroxychromene-2-carboxylate isomerase
MTTLDFWYEFASTYSYLAAMRVERLAGGAGVGVRWKPFLLGPIFQKQGWNDSPFNLYPVKGRYMWRDMERLCAREGLTLRRPSVFPRSGLVAARVASLGEPWVPEFTRRVYFANFAEDRDIATEATIGEILAAIGVPAAETITRALAPDNKEKLRWQTEEAAALGIFGAPSFVARGELFWGNDRLEQAIEWVRRT